MTASDRTRALRRNGRRGGRKRAARYGPAVLSQWASRGGNAVLQRYGAGHFALLRKRRELRELQAQCPMILLSPRTIAASKGGHARAKVLTSEVRRAIAQRGGIVTLSRHGHEFYRRIRKLRTYYPTITERTKKRIRENAVENARTAHPALQSMWLSVAREFSP